MKAIEKKGSGPLGWVVFGIVITVVLLFVYWTQSYIPAHNLDRCARGYAYAADGTHCP